jgi:hypothetical protein
MSMTLMLASPEFMTIASGGAPAAKAGVRLRSGSENKVRRAIMAPV